MQPVGAEPWTWFAVANLGLIIGVRHAFEPDHLMAIATLTASERSVRNALRLGASWGIGHATTLLMLGATLALLRASMPDTLTAMFEGFVAVMVIAIGVDCVRRGWRDGRTGMPVQHRHPGRVHAHPTSEPHLHFGPFAVARRPLLVGVLHGLAGSGALTALALAALPTLTVQVIFMLLFGLGSTVGMATIAGLAGWPLAKLAQRPWAMAGLRVATGVAAIIFGMTYARPQMLVLLSAW